MGAQNFRLAVTGGRDYADTDRVWAALDAVHAKRPVGVLVHGDYRGVDHLARSWALARGVVHEPHTALWEVHGGRAGPLRNQEMVDSGLDGLVSFPGGSGTADMTQRARQAGVPVWAPYLTMKD